MQKQILKILLLALVIISPVFSHATGVSVQTNSPAGVTDTSATLSGTANVPYSYSTFRYAKTANANACPALLLSTSPSNPSALPTTNFSYQLTGLDPQTIYCFKAQILDSNGSLIDGATLSFTTTATIAALPAALTVSSGTVHATTDSTTTTAHHLYIYGDWVANGAYTTTWFQYKRAGTSNWLYTTPKAHHKTGPSYNPAAYDWHDYPCSTVTCSSRWGIEMVEFNESNPLVWGDNYTFQFVAQNSVGTVYSTVENFKAPDPLPDILGVNPINVQTNLPDLGLGSYDDTSATFSGSAELTGRTLFGYFRYAAMTNPPLFCNDIYGTRMQATSDAQLDGNNVWKTFTKKVTNLTPNTTYYYCAVASDQSKNRIGYGGVKQFTTKPCSTCAQTTIQTLQPEIIDLSVGNSTSTTTSPRSAKMIGFYNTNVKAITWFEYRKVLPPISTGSLNNAIIDQELPWSTSGAETPRSASTSGKLSELLTGLDQNSKYEYRAVIKDNDSADKTFGKIYYGDSIQFTFDSPINVINGNNSNGTGPGINTNYTGFGTNPCDIMPPPPPPPNPNTAQKLANGLIVNPIVLPVDPVVQMGDPCDPTANGIGNNLGGNPTGGNPTGGLPTGGNPNGNGTLGNGVFGNSNTGTGMTSTVPTVGSVATPISDAIVHSMEGVETVFIRQIMNYPGLAKLYGYQDGTSLQTFANNLADTLGQIFGYVNASGREVRVSIADMAAYEIGMVNGKLAIYEYYGNKLTGIRTTTTVLKNTYGYEYYFAKK